METPPLLNPTNAAAGPKRKGRGKLVVLIIILLALVALAALWSWQKKSPGVTVQTEKVARHSITETVTANGKIYPVVQVHISPEVSGEIIELKVKEGQYVHKGDLLLKINPDVYIAGLNQAKASYESSLAAKDTALANLEKAETDYNRNVELFHRKLISESDYIGFKVALDVARAQVKSAGDQVNVSKASVDNEQDLLNKTTIVAPLDGTITTLNSQLGERVLGTVQNAGTDIMIISDLSAMEARVDVGEMDVVLLQPGQRAKLEVDSYKDRKFAGEVTAVANSSEGLNAGSALGGYSSSSSSSSSGQAATQFQVRIRITDEEQFRPGMSVSAEIETRSRTNILAVPIACVTTRVPKAATNSVPGATNAAATAATATTSATTADGKTDKKAADAKKPVDIVFVVNGDSVKAMPVKIGISDNNFWEITDGLKEGDEIVTGGYHAIMRDLDDGKKIVKGVVAAEPEKPTP